jgi:catechol 2,3-dioxygenase-like lactoylglutathione lyase family enzyme
MTLRELASSVIPYIGIDPHDQWLPLYKSPQEGCGSPLDLLCWPSHIKGHLQDWRKQMDVPMRVPEPTDVISPARFAHIVLYTKKFQELVDWYCLFLGASITGASQGLAFLTYDDEHHRIAIIETPDYKDREPNTVGMAHFAYSYDTLADMAHQYERLKDAGVMPVRTINHGPTTSLYYRDPDQNAVEIQVDNFPNIEALNEWFATGEFNRNPIGVNFDFDELVERLKAGEPESVLLYPREGEAAPLMNADHK